MSLEILLNNQTKLDLFLRIWDQSLVVGIFMFIPNQVIKSLLKVIKCNEI